MRLSSRLDGVSSRLKTAQSMKGVRMILLNIFKVYFKAIYNCM